MHGRFKKIRKKKEKNEIDEQINIKIKESHEN